MFDVSSAPLASSALWCFEFSNSVEVVFKLRVPAAPQPSEVNSIFAGQLPFFSTDVWGDFLREF